MLGSTFSLVIGYLSDRYGRKKVTLILLGLVAITISTSQLFISSVFNLPVPVKYSIYSLSKFLLGILCVGLFTITYVLLFELTARRHVTMVSNINVYLYVLGEIAVAALSFMFRSWHVINWFMAAFSLLVLVLTAYFLPESPRFLIVHKRYNELYRDLRRIAMINGREARFDEMNERDVIDSLLDNFNNNKNNSVIDHENCEDTQMRELSIIGYLVKSRRHLFARVILLSYIWFTISLVYFGISLGESILNFIIIKAFREVYLFISTKKREENKFKKAV